MKFREELGTGKSGEEWGRVGDVYDFRKSGGRL